MVAAGSPNLELSSPIARDMQLAEFRINDLFGHFDHHVVFPNAPEDDPTPSLTILHGPNGVGKTTVLKMLDGLMRLDFDVFRTVPFGSCMLQFTHAPSIAVEKRKADDEQPLNVVFGEHEVLLHPAQKGPFRRTDQDAVDAFRKEFFLATESLSFELIGTSRLREPFVDAAHRPREEWPFWEVDVGRGSRTFQRVAPRERDRPTLAERVAKFIRDAQVDYRRFFASPESDVFPRVLQILADQSRPRYRADDLINKLGSIQAQEKMNQAVGLSVDSWDYETLVEHLRSVTNQPNPESTLAFIGAYAEVLQSRAEQRSLVAERLQTFVDVMEDFLLEKRVVVSARRGFRIVTDDGTELLETQLSSGEYNLLFLMVSALVTTRRGTVIAIDEPEMSMHISWQRKLIPNLIRCASNATPQFILATHSPDIVADHRFALVPFGTRNSEYASP